MQNGSQSCTSVIEYIGLGWVGTNSWGVLENYYGGKSSGWQSKRPFHEILGLIFQQQRVIVSYLV